MAIWPVAALGATEQMDRQNWMTAIHPRSPSGRDGLHGSFGSTEPSAESC